MQKIFNLTNKYIILATPLILYSLFSSVYFIISAGNGRIINIIFAIILFTLMTAAFIAGWLKMVNLAVCDSNDTDPNSLIKEFPAGVGEYFLSSIGALLVISFISAGLYFVTYTYGMAQIGNPDISTEAISKALQSTNELKLFLSSLSTEQISKINQWNILILGTTTFIYYIFVLYFPALFMKTKNPIKAFFISLKDLFSKKILKTTGIFVSILVINLLLSTFSALLGANVIMHFILTLLNFYFIVFVSVAVFYYYKTNFVSSLEGQNIDIEI